MPERIDIRLARGEIFFATREASDTSVLWGELFNEKERKFLRENLKTERIGVPLRDACNINVRTLWQPEERALRERNKASLVEAAAGQQPWAPGKQVAPVDAAASAVEEHVLVNASAKRRKANMLSRCHTENVVMVLHAASGVLTSSWAWTKLGMPLYKQGYSVIFLDLPGFGMSSCAEDPYCPVSRWKSYDHEIVQSVMDRLEVNCCNFLATGEGCNTVVRMLQKSPTYIAKYHIFHNPIITLDELSPKTMEMSLRGNHAGSLQSAQQHDLEHLLASANCRIWSTFSDTCGPHQEAYDVLCLARRHPLLRFTLSVTTVTKEHICPVQVGCRVPIWILFPCKFLRKRYAEFLSDPSGYMPAETLPAGCAGEASTASSSVIGTARTAQNSSRLDHEGGQDATLLEPPRSIAGSSSRSLPSLRTLDSRRTHAGVLSHRPGHSSSETPAQLPRLSTPEGNAEASEASARQVRYMGDYAREAAALAAPDPGPFRERQLVRTSMEAAALWNQRQADIIRSLDCRTPEQPQILQAMQNSMYTVQEDDDRRSQKRGWRKGWRGLRRLSASLLPGLGGNRGAQG